LAVAEADVAMAVEQIVSRSRMRLFPFETTVAATPVRRVRAGMPSTGVSNGSGSLAPRSGTRVCLGEPW